MFISLQGQMYPRLIWTFHEFYTFEITENINFTYLNLAKLLSRGKCVIPEKGARPTWRKRTAWLAFYYLWYRYVGCVGMYVWISIRVSVSECIIGHRAIYLHRPARAKSKDTDPTHAHRDQDRDPDDTDTQVSAPPPTTSAVATAESTTIETKIRYNRHK
jgi:hypothetical protein